MEQIAKYIYEVYKRKSFTSAAKALFISQPALSSAISRFEKELNFRIFDRSNIPLTLTPHGRAYIDMVEEMLESENNLHRRIRELSNTESRSISIGIKGYSSYFLASSVASKFSKKSPDVRVSIQVGNAGNANFLFEKLANEEIDLLFTNKYDSDFITIPIYNERYVIAMHKTLDGAEKLAPFALTHKEIITREYDKNREIEDTSIFKDISFLSFAKLSPTTKIMEQLFGQFKTAPYKILTSRHSEMHYNLMCAGIGAVLITDTTIAKTHHDSDDILYFVPKSEEVYRTIYLQKKHSTDNNPTIREFIEITQEVCQPKHILSPNIYIP